MNDAIIGISGNLEPERHIPAAQAWLQAQFQDVREAPTYATPAIGRPHEGDYWNTASRISTGIPLADLQAQLREVEAAAGRRRTDDKFAARTLDLDVMLWNGEPLNPESAAELESRPWNPWLLHHLRAGPKPLHVEPARAV